MKTAMQQLIEYLDPIHSAIKDKAIELLELENEQIIEFGRKVVDHWGMTEVPKEYIEQYYNETYQNK